jgi:ATP-dependent protease ClpP protease subunit
MKSWYQINKAKNRTAKIFIFDDIGQNWWGEGISSKEFIEEINALDVDEIDLLINSWGGYVHDGYAIYNGLADHPATINVKIYGVAASIASLIAMAGNTVEMPENSMMFIHNPFGGIIGTAEDMRSEADGLDKMKNSIVAAYKTRAKIESDEISDMMDKSTWISADEAVEMGFADKKSDPIKIEASNNVIAKYQNIPKCLMESLTIVNQIKPENSENFQPKKEDSTMEITLDLIKNKHPDIVAAILAGAAAEDFKKANPAAAAALSEEGKNAETQRIKDVRETALLGHEKLVVDMMFDGKTTGPEAALKILNAEKKIRNDAAKNLETDSPDKISQPSTDTADTAETSGSEDEGLPIEEAAKKDWEKDAKTRKEFDNDYDQYLAYRKAADDGQVRIRKQSAATTGG